MSLNRLMNQALSLQRLGGETTDAYGNTIPGPLGAPVTVYGFLEQNSSNEILVDRDTVLSTWNVYLPAGTEIGHLDRITWNNQVFEVDGEPAFFYNPRTAQISHIKAMLKAVQG